jgi:hypothetical protein
MKQALRMRRHEVLRGEYEHISKIWVTVKITVIFDLMPCRKLYSRGIAAFFKVIDMFFFAGSGICETGSKDCVPFGVPAENTTASSYLCREEAGC